jgi:predicted permease
LAAAQQSRAKSLWRALRRRRFFEDDMREEVRFHLDARAAHLVKQGMSPADAVRRARLEFGNPAAWQEQCRDARGLRLFDDLAQDLRFAFRGLRQRTALSAIVIATLTFGIGVSSGVFTLFDAIALRARIDTDPASFVRIFTTSTTDPTRPGRLAGATVEEYAAFRDRARTLRALAAYHRFAATVGAHDDMPTRILLVSCDFFGVYGVERALVGRLLQFGDCDAATPVVVIGEGLWRSRFSADAGIVGSTIPVNGKPVTVVGVAPRSTAEVDNSATWLPWSLRPYLGLGADPRGLIAGPLPQERWLSLVGRLSAGTNREAVNAELSVLASQDDRLHPGRTSRVIVTDGAMMSDPGLHTVILSVMTLVMGALTCLVLIACANVATLLLSQADARHREIAIRLSLGAGRGRLSRMLLTEVLVLAAFAGVGSVYVAYQVPLLLMRWLVGTLPPFSLTPDWRVFAYLAITTGLAGVAAGMAPAAESMRVDVVDSLKGRRSTLGVPGGATLRHSLIAIQVALSFVLLIGAGLFVVTHYRIVTSEPGFDSRQILVPRVTLRDGSSTPSPNARPAAILEALSDLPGVEAIAFAGVSPVAPPPTMSISTRDSAAREINVNEISPNYFRAVGIPIRRGRAFDEADRPCVRQACHVVVSDAFARQLLAPGEPLGQVVRDQAGDPLEVVGTVQDTSAQQIGQPDPPTIYMPWRPDIPYQPVIRFAGDRDRLTTGVAEALRRRFPDAVVDARTARWFIDAWLDEVGRIEVLIVALGAAAAALSVIGVFGVVSFAVSRRTREIGVRIALGARPAEIYRTVMAAGLKPVVTGLACGIVMAVLTAVAFARLLAQFHFAVSPTDPPTYFAVTGLLVAVILAALAFPARRAASVNPLDALRYE